MTPQATEHPILFNDDMVRAQSLTCRHGFALLWDSIYADKGLGWDVNPWIWGAEFNQVPKVTR